MQAEYACCKSLSSPSGRILCQKHYLGFPLVSDQEVVGREVSVHHIVAMHELHSGCSLAGQLQSEGPGAIQAEAGRGLQCHTY